MAHIVDEERTGAELAGVDQMGIEPQGCLDARDDRLAHPRALAIEHVDQWVALGSVRVSSILLTITASTSSSSMLGAAPGRVLVMEAIEALGQEPPAPLLHRGRGRAQTLGYLGDMATFCALENNAAPKRHLVSSWVWVDSPAFELLVLVVAQHHRIEN